MLVGLMIVRSEAKRARRSWREAKRKWHEIEAVAVEIPKRRSDTPPNWWSRAGPTHRKGLKPTPYQETDKRGVRLLLFHGSDQNPLAIIEPDAKYFRLYRIRYPDGHLSDMVNLTRAKDAACSFALRSLNSPPQETPSQGSQPRKKAEAEGETLAKAQIASSGLLVDCLRGGGREAAQQH
jgi:hypothetical protein